MRFAGDPELPDHARTKQSAFPLSARCVSDVQASVEMVPGFVNPAVVVCLAGAVVFAAVAVIKRRRPRNYGGDDVPVPAESARA
ncbi:hypothetical protein [Streptomyces griseocarneus]|uniref:hypothetical protein n=1 Tax=Streptomyces griseocarneus TaxID=51201 RepID=UPI001CCAFC8E|nr:hypothetical protein [Streptomyces griseocarneus]MBZ6473963.1 hypothetical protein [Streptomyces griseocarneus]